MGSAGLIRSGAHDGVRGMTTKADLARFRALQKLGCIACRQRGVFSQPDIHHLLSGGRRRGNRYTIPLCPCTIADSLPRV